MAQLVKFSRQEGHRGSRNTITTSDLTAKVEIWSFRVCAMHPAIRGSDKVFKAIGSKVKVTETFVGKA